MAFVCPPKEDNEVKAKLLSDLKKTMQEIEDKLTISVNPICVPVCVPLIDLPVNLNKGKGVRKVTNQEIDPPDVMVCYKVCEKKKKADKQDHNSDNQNQEEFHRVKQSKSRELRASILYTGCDCEKRDGLQDDCQRTGCHGSPECLTRPPTCGPSEFCNGKHLMKKIQSKNSPAEKNGPAKSDETDKFKYKCFPAVIKSPVCCNCNDLPI